ncbi:hypothetical protein VZT92_010515 [Zoarces viviparus]|uniref:Uncharacterized protein n=1 Tax=Zoarces viviparus TaxID=48416 RepID=A0AAW1F8K1_ZOAVI
MPPERSLTQHPGVSLGGRENVRVLVGRALFGLVFQSHEGGERRGSKGERRAAGGDEFSVSHNVRPIDSEGSVFTAHPSRSSRSLVLSRSGGTGPNPAPATLPRLIEACCCKWITYG